jgi:hypothetical protein
MAAGRGSRYGGPKQLDNLGPSGETLLDYAVYDARRAGFTRFVFVTRADLVPEMTGRVRRFSPDVHVTCAVQDDGEALKLPGAATRTRPWGTVHAVLAAGIGGDGPLVALNADDFYGQRAYELAAHACRSTATTGAAAVIGMFLEDTLSPHGPVVRALCNTRDGWLVALDEVYDIVREESGAGIVGRTRDRSTRTFSGREVVSMNLWILPAAMTGPLTESLAAFAGAHTADPEAELPLPEAIGALVAAGRANVRVMESPGPWLGLTHARDRAGVVNSLQTLVDRGVYPRILWAPDGRW